jgi:hypothetical protein
LVWQAITPLIPGKAACAGDAPHTSPEPTTATAEPIKASLRPTDVFPSFICPPASREATLTAAFRTVPTC